MERQFENYARFFAAALLVVGCFVVLRPFLAAILFAAVVCASTWPLYLRVLHWLNGRAGLAALAMTLSLVLLVVVPLALVAYNLAGDVGAFFSGLRKMMAEGPPAPPAWLTGLPVVGDFILQRWHEVTGSQEEMIALIRRLLEPTKNFLLAGGIILGRGVLEMTLSAFVCFFFYRDGRAFLLSLGAVMDCVAGPRAGDLLDIINNTVRSVMYGLVGTALAQSFVAAVGFAIAGVPGVLLLALATFLLSLVPIGPPLVWGGVAIWLFSEGEFGWGIFMLLWGTFLISGVDNVVKPMLISRSGNLPFLLVLLGVMGGVLAFGFVGIFIGPTFLAVGLSLARNWTAGDRESPTQ